MRAAALARLRESEIPSCAFIFLAFPPPFLVAKPCGCPGVRNSPPQGVTVAGTSCVAVRDLVGGRVDVGPL